MARRPEEGQPTNMINRRKEEDMRREDDDRYRRGVRNGGPSFETRFNTDYLDETSLSDFRSNEPKFELDHLATFAAGSRNGVIHAEDGLRKLRQMENTTGIWTMRCMLIVERGNLVILDNSTAEELERFPIQLVQDPTAIFKNDRREIYNNLILFTIVDDAKRRGSAADMHIFQSCKSPAQEIVDEILAAKNGQQRIYPPGGGSRIPPPPMGPAPELPYDHQGMSFGESRQFVGQQRSFITRVGGLREKEDYTGGSTEILERDVQLLNHCFDDIEKFVARLQQAAESYKELEKRKRDRGAKNKKRQSGDGMLNARAKPPPDRDFVDIFQKFKLSFNLLAKLKAHIHDPNAPELVHFLFTPLSLIYEASRDPFHGNQNLGDQAVAPVLTPDAKQLLINCLTTKEVELWHALGKHWTTSRDEWIGHIPPYVPEFYDGWQPAATILDDMTVRPFMSQPVDDRPFIPVTRPMPFPDEDRQPIRMDDNLDRFESSSQGGLEPVAGPSRLSPRLARTSAHTGSPYNPEFVERPQPDSNFTHAVIEPKVDENAAYFEELRSMGNVLIYEAAHERKGKNEKELTVQKGDILQVLDNSRNWWKLRNHKGQVGFAPYTILKAVKTDLDHHNDRGLTNGGGMPLSYRSDNFIDDNSSRRGMPRRGSRHMGDLAGFYEGNPRTRVESTSTKEKPKVAPRRGSESNKALETPAEITADSDRSGTPKTGPFFTRTRAQSLQSPAFLDKGAEIPIIGPLTLSETEYSHIHPEKRHTTRRLTQPSVSETSKLDASWLEDLTSKMAARNTAKSAAPVSDSGEPGISQTAAADRSLQSDHTLESARIRSRNSPRSARPENVTHINERSTAAEVTDWLTIKKFSDRTIQVFFGHTGLDMFHLRLADFQQLLSRDEATRLDGLLTLQKNSSGYGTRTAKELNEILKRRKQHVTETENNRDDQEPIPRDPPADPHPNQAEGQPASAANDYRTGQSGTSFQQQLIRQKSQLRQSQGELDMLF